MDHSFDVSFDVINPPVIKVDMAVSRCHTIDREPLGQLWGHIGDYEVSIWLPIEDVCVRRLLELAEQDQNGRRQHTPGNSTGS